MKILFICKHNRFRSKVAEAIASKLDTRCKKEYKSAGVQIDLMRPYVAESVKEILNERGFQIENEQSRQVNEQDLKWADKIVIVANNVSPTIFGNKEVEVWRIEDADESEKEKIEKIVSKIEKRVNELISEL